MKITLFSRNLVLILQDLKPNYCAQSRAHPVSQTPGKRGPYGRRSWEEVRETGAHAAPVLKTNACRDQSGLHDKSSERNGAEKGSMRRGPRQEEDNAIRKNPGAEEAVS